MFKKQDRNMAERLEIWSLIFDLLSHQHLNDEEMKKKNKPEYDSAFVLSLFTQLFHFM